MTLELAIKARVPLIAVQTSDVINIKNYLKDISGEKPYAYKNGDKVFPNRLYYFYHDKLQLAAIETLYEEMTKKESSLVIVNQEEKHSAFYEAGILTASKRLIENYLKEYMRESDVKKIMPSLGGLTLKEVTEVIMITQTRDKFLSNKGIIQTRKLYVQKVHGMEMVDTSMPSYRPDKRLKEYAKKQKPFFVNGPDERLTPRGIIAHGMAGTGKTAGAKYLGEQWGVPVYRLDATVQSHWAGESEKNIAAALNHLVLEAPCILVLDEIEKLFSKTSDGGSTQKMLGILLWWLQEHKARVLTYMTCNDIKILPPELYRSGRIDEKFKFEGVNLKDAVSLGNFILGTYKLKGKFEKESARLSEKYIKAKFKKTKTIAQATVEAMVKKAIKEAYLKKGE